MTPDEQLEEWVKGNSIHNTDRDECCPDFSCCCPKLLAPEDERKTFQAGNEELRMQMCMIFLERSMLNESLDKLTHIINSEVNSYGKH